MSEERERFEAWRDTMDVSLDSFRAGLPAEVAERLDGSEASLEALEAWLLDEYADTSDMRPREERFKVDGAARYFGEILRRELGGRWDIELEQRRSMFPGVPIIREVGPPGGPPVAPLFAVSAATDRRTGTFLRDMVESLRKAKEAA
jgi:hypothetical protein